MTDRASAEGLRELEQADPFAPHDLGCRCWPHVSQRAAVEASVQAAVTERRALRSSESDSGLDVVTSYPSPGESAGFDALVEQLAAAIHAYGGLCRSTYGNRSCVSRDHRVMAEGIAAHFEVRLSTPRTETSEP